MHYLKCNMTDIYVHVHINYSKLLLSSAGEKIPRVIIILHPTVFTQSDVWDGVKCFGHILYVQ